MSFCDLITCVAPDKEDRDCQRQMTKADWDAAAGARLPIFERMSDTHIGNLHCKTLRARRMKVAVARHVVCCYGSARNSFATFVVSDLSGGRATG